MEIEELRDFIGRIKYKPGFKVTLHGSEFFSPLGRLEPVEITSPIDPYVVRFQLFVTDADDFSKQNYVTKDFMLEPHFVKNTDEKRMTAFLFSQIKDLELHEAGEFFKVDGVKVFDPHAEK